MKTCIIIAFCLFALVSQGAKKTDNSMVYSPGNNKMYHKDWIDFNKNGKMDVYENPKANINDRIEDLLSQMTMEEKTCQLVTLYGYGRILKDSVATPEWKNRLWKDGVGAIDEMYNGYEKPKGAKKRGCSLDWPPAKHTRAINDLQKWFIEETRLGIPVDMTNEGIRGCEAWATTDFPHAIGLGATWDRDLLYKIGYITGREANLLGYTNIYSPVVDVMRDQRWGRCEESYSESPYLVGELGVAMAQGVQKDFQVAATAKHFLAYSNNKGAREGKSRTDFQGGLRTVFDLHLYPYTQLIKRAGILGVMACYNDIDGEPVEGSNFWLMKVLRKLLGFQGYVVSDSQAVEFQFEKHRTAKDREEGVNKAINAGLNIRCNFEEPETYVLPMRSLLAKNELSMDTVDARVRDVLRVKFLVGLFDKPYKTDLALAEKEINSKESNEVSLQASRECVVLLKNESNLLPLDFSKLKKVAVIGPNADEIQFALGHYGPQQAKVTSVLEGLRNNLAGKCEVGYEKGVDLVDKNWPESEILREPLDAEEQTGVDKAVALAKESDVAIVVLGGGNRTCGESHSRSSIDLPGHQEELLRAVQATGKPTIVVLINGRPLSINWAKAHCNAILEAWYPGAHGGQAIYDILSGAYNPSGKLNVTIPKTAGQIPFNFPTKPNANIDGGNRPGLKGNQTRVNGALWYFGEGLSYTTYKYSNISVYPKQVAKGDTVTVTFQVTNTGKRAGEEIAQLYITDMVSSVTSYEKNLVGFERVNLQPGETKTVKMRIMPEMLTVSNLDYDRIIEKGDFKVTAGPSSVDTPLETMFTATEDWILWSMPK